MTHTWRYDTAAAPPAATVVQTYVYCRREPRATNLLAPEAHLRKKKPPTVGLLSKERLTFLCVE